MTSSLPRWVVLGVVVLGIGAVHLASLREGHIWGDDFAEYLLHARNLVEGSPYAAIGYVYNPHYPAIGPPTYPPGCPLILAPVYALFGLNLTALKVEMIALFLVFLVAVYLCFGEALGFCRALALVAIVGLNHYFLKDANTIGSDMPFLALVYLGLWMLQKAEAAPPDTWRRSATLLAAGALAYLAYSTRSLGALLIPAMLAQEVLSRRRITWPAVLATGLFLVLAALQACFFHSDRHYLDQLGAGPMVLVHNAANYLVRFATFWHSGYLKAPSMLLFAAFSLLAILGYVETLRRHVTICEVFIILYVGVILLWPSYQGERYLYPVLPLYVYYGLRGLDHRWIASRAGLRRAVAAILAVAIGLTYAGRLAGLPRGPLAEGVAKRQSLELFDYLRNSTSKDDVIVFIKPRAMALFTGRKASVYHRAEDQALWDYFRQIRASRLVVVENDHAMAGAETPEMLDFLRKFVQRNNKRLERVFRNSDFSVYRFVRCK